MFITSNDIKAGPAHLESKLAEFTIQVLEDKPSPVNHFCLGYLFQQAAKQEAALRHYEQVMNHWKTGEPAFYARYSAGILAQNLEYPWPKVEDHLLAAFQALPERGESILRIIHYYQSKQQWPIAYLFSKFASEQFHGKMPAARNWGMDKSLYSWKVLDVHKVSCYNVQKIDEATAAYSTLCRLMVEDPTSFLAEDITRIARQKFLFPGLRSYEKSRPQYHLQ